jgi:hypothetical protein
MWQLTLEGFQTLRWLSIVIVSLQQQFLIRIEKERF